MQIRWIINILMVLALIFSYSCVEKYTPEINDYDDQLVVDGLITNCDEPYIITLSKTSPVDDSEYRPYQNATVIVEDNNGNTYLFEETDSGNYINNSFTGEPGVSYRLQISTMDGKNYTTEFQEMPPHVPIDTVSYEIESRSTTNPDYDEIGCQFYISTQDPDNNQKYFFWKLVETYEYNSDYPMEFIYNGYLEAYPNPMEFFTCWTTNKVNKIYLFDASTLSSVNLQNIPLNYVNTETRKLSVRYSLLVNQYTISKQTYDFFKAVDELNSGEDLFNAIQPYHIKGNVECVSNPDEVVLGNFWVAGKSQQRIFVNRPAGIIFYYDICTVNTQGMGYIGMYSELRYPIFVTYNSSGEMGIVGESCVDCRLRGGKTVRPDFW